MKITDTSPMYLQFLIVPCYYIICFGYLMGFIMHFYIIFGTNLLTKGLVQIAIFFAYFSVSQKRNIKWNPNGMKPSAAWFFGRISSGRLVVHVRRASRGPRGWRARPLPRGLLGDFLTSTPSPLDHVFSENHVPEGFIPFGLRLIFFSVKHWNRQKTTIWAGPPVNRLVPKII